MIALEVSSAAGRPPHGGIGGSIRSLVAALLEADPETRYALCYRLSRWRKGSLFRPRAGNVRVRVLQDPWNALLIRGARLLHSMSTYLPETPRIPRIVTLYDLNAVRNLDWVRPEWHRKRTRRIRQAISRADWVVTTSEAIRAEVIEELGVADSRVRSIPLGVDLRRFRPSAPEVVRSLRQRYGDFVISVALATPRKNLPRLIEAVARTDGLRLVLVGRASDGEAEVQAAIERSGIGERLERLARIPEPQLVGLLGAARVCAVPSLYEGFGLSVLEAMACGTPVVCSESSALPEAAGGAALLVDAEDVDAIASALRRVLDDDPLATGLRERGFARAREMTWERSASRLRALYREVAGI
ncbi:MAG: glycosyltransferase family 4 protein [Myxococcota bacterium]